MVKKFKKEKTERKKVSFILLISLFIILLDQLTKLFVSKNISKPVPILNIFYLTNIKNTGAAFGILQNQTLLLTFISIFVIGLIVYYYDKVPTNKLIWLCVGLLLGGTVGNLIDRVRLGYVVDFLDFRIWPAFNIADSAVTIGAIGIIIYFLKKKG